ncbi:MAG: hypothetical protein AAB074_02450 [Planctomycetota bacterium]
MSAFKVGKITVYAKSALSSDQQIEFRKSLTSLYSRYNAQFGLDKEFYKADALDAFPKPKDSVDLVIFDSLESYQGWSGGTDAAGVTIHTGLHENVIGVPLNEGAISPESWWTLTHLMSDVFYAHILVLGNPEWLKEGLSEYFASTSKLYVPTQQAAFKDKLKRLDDRRKAEKPIKVTALLRMDSREFGSEECDQAWLLTHLLVTEHASLLNDLVGATRAFESDASADLPGVQSDIRKYSAKLLEDSFGGASKVQAAMLSHLEELIANPADPARLKLRPTAIAAGSIAPEVDCKIVNSVSTVVDSDGTVSQARASNGTLRYRAPWPATVRILITVGDDKGHWSEELLLRNAGSMKAGGKEAWADELLPKFKNARQARITIEWKVDGGGTYRTVKVIRDK